MAPAILIVNDGSSICGFGVHHKMVSPRKVHSFTYTGERWPVVFDKQNRKIRYTDEFGAVYQIRFPPESSDGISGCTKEIFDDIFDCEDLKFYHNTNKTRFSTRPGKNEYGVPNYYVRLVFSHPRMVNKYQMLFKYDVEMIPMPLDMKFFEGYEPVYLEKNRL